jgi:hypothetical protein
MFKTENNLQTLLKFFLNGLKKRKIWLLMRISQHSDVSFLYINL